MAQKTKQEHLIDERARLLAGVYLTRRDDLVVSEERTDFGIDFWVNESKESYRRFGVQVKGSWGSATAEEANRILRPTMRRMQGHAEFPFPVVIFFFTMQDNGAWYTWAYEPAVSAEGFELVRQAEATCRLLDSEAIDDIVEAVDHWYNAFFAKALRRSPAKSNGSPAT